MNKEIGNSYKDLYYKNIENKQEISECELLYSYMQLEPDKKFNSKDIAEIFGKDNIASRLFKKLEVNELIKFVNVRDNNLMHYQIINPSKKFEIKIKDSNTKSLSTTKKILVNLLEYSLRDEVDYITQQNLIKIFIRISKDLKDGKDVKNIKIRNPFLLNDEDRMFEYYSTKELFDYINTNIIKKQ